MHRFRLLGPLEVRAGDEWRGLGAPKWRAVLAVLLINADRVVSVDTLISAVWGEAAPVKAANLINIYVLRLRRLLGDSDSSILVTRAPGYLLRVDPKEVDAQLFEAMVRDGRRALAAKDPGRAAGHLAEALALWHGSALADVPRTQLIEAEADRLEELQLGAAELRITAELDCGGHAEVVPELRRLLTDHPLREGLWLLLMKALDGSGRHAEALDVYGQARKVIAEELGVDPGAELRRLYTDLLAQDAARSSAPAGLPAGLIAVGTIAAATPVLPEIAAAQPDEEKAEQQGAAPLTARSPRPTQHPAQLPTDIADFTGREDQVKHLSELLAATPDGDSGAVRVALVAGYGGLGKTSLAVHAAHRVRAHFPDGQLYVDLLGATAHPLPPSDVLARFLRDLGVDGVNIPVDEAERAARYRTVLAGRRLLIVLDNARDAAQVRPLLPGSAACAVLITTRSRMPDLARTKLVDLNMLDDDEALTLFTRVVGDARAAAEPEATAELLEACGGLPLAIRICAARLATHRSWTIRSMANRLRDEHRRLDELTAGDLAVRASFEVSFASLPKSMSKRGIDPAQAFCLLGLWQGPAISAGTAAALFGTDDATDTLELLVNANLLQCTSPDQYTFQDLLRVYASERAAAQIPEPDRHAAVTRLLTWYMRSADVVRVSLRRPEEIAWLLDTLRQAGASDAITALLARDPAAHASLDDPRATAQLLRALDQTGASDAFSALTTRATLVSAHQPDGTRPAADIPQKQVKEPMPDPGKTEKAASREGFGRALTAALSRAGLTAAQAASAAGITADLAEAWCSGERLPSLTTNGLTGLRAVLATCGITSPDQILVWTDILIQTQAQPGPQEDRPGQLSAQPAQPVSDTPGYDLCPDPLKARTTAEFVQILADYRTWAGAPSLRDIERACNHEISIATMSSALRGTRLPPLRTVLAIIRGCGGPLEHRERFATAWRKLQIPPAPSDS